MDIKVNTQFVEQSILDLYDDLEGIIKTKSLEEISKAVFTISATEFTKFMAKEAKANKKALHHVYEWDKTGVTKYKLFEVRRVHTSNGSVTIRPYFIESTMVVPIPAVLRTPGKTGKFVSAQHIFKHKAQVMEDGEPTKAFTSLRGPGTALAFLSTKRSKKIRFVKYPKSVIINNPGGPLAKGAFFERFELFFNSSERIEAAISKTGFIKALDTAIYVGAKTKKSNFGAEIRKNVIEVSNKYSKGLAVV